MARRKLKISNPDVREAVRSALALGVMPISDACRSIRALYGYSQEELANYIGLSIKVIKDIESGKGNPRLSSLKNLADAAGLKVVFSAPKGIVNLNDINERNIEKKLSRNHDFDLVSSGNKSSEQVVSANALRIKNYNYVLPESN